MRAAEDRGVGPGRRADSERGCGGEAGAVVSGAVALSTGARGSRRERSRLWDAVGNAWERGVAGREECGAVAYRSRRRCRPRQSPVISPRQPRGPDAPAGGARRFSFCCLFCASRRQRDGGGCGRGSGALPQHRCAGRFLRTTSRSSRARVSSPPTTGEAAKLTFLESSHGQAGFLQPWEGAVPPLVVFPEGGLCCCLGRRPVPVTGGLQECNAVPGLAGPGPGCGTGQFRARQPRRARDGENIS